jgi:subtilisin family serine protease
MKNLLIYVLFITSILNAQVSPQQRDLMNFEPGELIVKLKDNVDAGITYAKNGKATSSFNIGQLLGISDKVKSSTMMFHQKSIEASIVNKQKMKAVYAAKAVANPNNGYQPKEPLTMKNVFVLKTSNEQENILQLIQQIKDDPNVEYAEPNFIYSADDFEVGEAITAEEASKMSSNTLLDVNDPLYSSQNNIVQTNIDDVWEQYTTGDGSQVIAILDTGVDYTHPDLEANIWINEAELNGVAGYDDDGNGYVDDIRGWDFFHDDNTPLDDNMHGTHVAGIAGAVGNNGIGIAGAAWNVKLMPIKVLQSSGSGNTVDIANGVSYASENGATIINMSFAGSRSNLVESALALAYTNSLLIASVGNNSKCTEGPLCQFYYPAGYSFVLGVASPGGFSNFDNTGPYYQSNFEFDNYELIAPGTSIISTVPNRGYASLTGTSMASPLIAGAAALYNQIKNSTNKEILFGDFINSGEIQFTDGFTILGPDDLFDLLKAIEMESESLVKIYNIAQLDDNENNIYPNGTPNAGEIIDLYVSAKNYWSTSGNIIGSIEIGGNELQNQYYSSLVTITDNTAELGTLSDYAYGSNTTDPFSVTLNENIIDGTEIEFIISIWDEDNPDVIDSRVHVVTVTNMITLVGPITSDLTLAEGSYLVNNEIFYINNATLTILPGTTIYFRGGYGQLRKINNGKIIAIGNKDKNITFFNEMSSLNISIDECTFCNFYSTVQYNTYEFYSEIFQSAPNKYNYCNFGGKFEPWNGSFKSSVIKYSNIYMGYAPGSDNFGYGTGLSSTSPIDGSSYGPSVYYDDLGIPYHKYSFTVSAFKYNNMLGSSTIVETYSSEEINPDLEFTIEDQYSNYITSLKYGNENILSDGRTYITGPDVRSPAYNGFNEAFSDYYGKGFFHIIPYELNVFEDLILSDASDITDGGDGLFYKTDLLPTTPYSEAPGFVWKIDIGGKHALTQVMAYGSTFPIYPDIYLSENVGVGTYEFKIFFNREMDVSVNPQVSYGIRNPWTQKVISEEGTWSSDGKTFTVIHAVGIGAADGINRIIVQGAKDLNNFESVFSDIFKFNLQSAGSASAGWFATPGLGKISLEWTAPSTDEIDDALGYNMYRYQVDADGVVSTPVKLNETLIVEDTDESTTGVYYTDFDVTEGQTYFYKYNILRTSFETTDYSSVVSTSPLTSTLGDSNGDFSVDVMDLVHDVDYILGNNPTPFIFLAGDVNADLAINVLDIVGTVDIILNPSSSSNSSVGSNGIQFYPSQAVGNANFTWEGNDLYVASNHNIGGIQLSFNTDFEYVLSEDLLTIEHLDYTQEDSKILMLYSFNNTMIASSKTKILTRQDASQEFDVEQAVVGTTTGAKLNATLNNGTLSTIDAPFQSNKLQFLNLYPNPTKGLVNLEYYLPEQMDQVTATVYDLQGRKVYAQQLTTSVGSNESTLQLSKLRTGSYIVLMSGYKKGGVKYLSHKILILE